MTTTSHIHFISTWTLVAMLAYWTVGLSGCKRSGLVPVRGTITYGGGQWPKSGIRYFTVDKSASGGSQRPAMAHFDCDGNITITTFKKGDGLLPGTYQVGVECWKIPPKMGPNLANTPSYVIKKYQSPATSGLEVEVKPTDSIVEISFDVPKE